VSAPRLSGPFADPRFRKLLAGQLLSTFGDTALYLTLGIWAKTLTHSNAAAGSIFLALGLPALLGPAAGHVADRVRRKRLLIVTNALTAVLVLSLLAVGSASQLWILYLVAFGYGVSSALTGGANAGLQRDLLRSGDLAAANAALKSASYGMRIVAPLAGAGLFAAFGGGAVAVLDALTFIVAIGVLASIGVTESEPEPTHAGTLLREITAGFRHIRAVRLLGQVTFVSACAFCVIGFNETTIFAVIGEGLHRPPSFFGVLSSVQGAGAIAGGIAMTRLLARIGTARMVGLALGLFALGSLSYLTHSVATVFVGSFLDGIGLVWLVAVSGTAIQRHTPPRLQGRVTATWTMALVTPQTASIAAGAALIAFVDYRVLVLVVVGVTGASACVLLARPAAEPEAPALEPSAPEWPDPAIAAGLDATQEPTVPASALHGR
jgi:MFS family permease